MLRDAFESIAPYISNIREIEKFVKENEDKRDEEIEKILEEKINEETGTLKTDFKILLNEMRKMINTEM